VATWQHRNSSIDRNVEGRGGDPVSISEKQRSKAARSQTKDWIGI